MEVKHYIGVRICVGMTARTKQPFQLELGCKSEPQVYQGEKTTIPNQYYRSRYPRTSISGREDDNSQHLNPTGYPQFKYIRERRRQFPTHEPVTCAVGQVYQGEKTTIPNRCPADAVPPSSISGREDDNSQRMTCQSIPVAKYIRERRRQFPTPLTTEDEFRQVYQGEKTTIPNVACRDREMFTSISGREDDNSQLYTGCLAA